MAQLDLAALRIFRNAAAEGSISGAAVKLHRVQSNVSTRIRQLEERLGARLFVRDRRGLTLTDEGRILLDYADRLLSLSDEAVDAVQTAEPGGVFRIGTMESTAASRLPAILSRYHGRFPGVQVHLTTDTAGALLRALAANEIDAAFVAEPVTVANMHTEPVFEEELVLVGPGSCADGLSPAGINGRTIIAFEEGCAYRRYLEDWLFEEGIVPGAVLSVGSYLAILACVSAGTGYAVVPRSVLEMIGSNGEFQQRVLPEKYRRIRTLLVWRRDYVSPKLDGLRALVPFVGGGV